MSRVFRCGGFTLVELLVVITIIGLLAAILVPSVNGALKSAKKARAMGQVKDLKGACMRYFDEYGRPPVPKGMKLGRGAEDQVYDVDNKKIVDILTLSDDLEDPDVTNPKRIRFLELDAKTEREYQKEDRLLDPWGHEYQILVDLSYDEKIDLSSSIYPDTIHAKVGVRSMGANGEWDEQQAKEKKRDDVQSW